MRFHTFNKRIMIYDVPRNFIGDTHWREDEAVQDGDELQLEKGVLVQVGEAVGRIEQDLTALFEKKRQKQAASPRMLTSPPRPTLAATARSAPAPLSQLRPKSLNALLGTPRGPHGRAMLSAMSPYEHRQRGEHDNIEDGRAFKRQRLDSSLNQHAEISLWDRTADSLGTSRDQPKDNARAASSTSKNTEDTERDIIEVSSSGEETPVLQRVRPRKSSQDRDQQDQRMSSLDGTHLFVSQPSDNSLSRAETASPNMAVEPFENHLTVHKKAVPMHTISHAVVNPLRIIPRKPRKKLMYKDLLPQRPPSQGHAGNGRRRALDDELKNLGSAVSERPEIEIDPCKLQHIERTPKKAQSRKGMQQAEENLSGSSQAFSNTDRRDDNSPPELTLLAPTLALKRSHRSPTTSITVGDKDVGSRILALPKPLTNSFEAETYGFTKTPSRESYTHEDLWNAGFELSEPDKLLLMCPGPTIISASTDSKARGLQVSETDANPKDPPSSSQFMPEPIGSQPDSSKLPAPKPQASRDKPRDAPQPQLMLQARRPRVPPRPPPALLSLPRSPLRKSISESDKVRPPTGPKPPPPKRSLQKALSDMTGLRTAAKDAVMPEPAGTMLEEEDKDLGPWSREAFDLFGWMPAGKGKA